MLVGRREALLKEVDNTPVRTPYNDENSMKCLAKQLFSILCSSEVAKPGGPSLCASYLCFTLPAPSRAAPVWHHHSYGTQTMPYYYHRGQLSERIRNMNIHTPPLFHNKPQQIGGVRLPIRVTSLRDHQSSIVIGNPSP